MKLYNFNMCLLHLKLKLQSVHKVQPKQWRVHKGCLVAYVIEIT